MYKYKRKRYIYTIKSECPVKFETVGRPIHGTQFIRFQELMSLKTKNTVYK